MEEDNSDDELPSISLSQDLGTREVVMPSAREVADERARERHTELELQRLREQHSPPPPPAGAPPPPPARSDSSGSEGEAALAAAVRALRVLPAPAARDEHKPLARRLLALLPAPPHALQPYIDAFADDASPTAHRKLIRRMVHGISCAVSCGYNAWREEELVTCAGVLLAACLCAPPRPAPRAPPRRALHRALAAAPPHFAARLATLAATAATADDGARDAVCAARALLALSDCARGGPALAELLAALLVRRALALLFATGHDDSSEPLSMDALQELVCRGWRPLAPPARLLALRLVARALSAPGGRGAGQGRGEGRARVVAALAHPPPQADKQHPDYLKVAVAASTLQLLYRAPPAAPHSHTHAQAAPGTAD